MRGFSMGGAACWQFAVHYPEHVGRRRAGRRLLRDRRLPQGLPERDGPADLVREEALAPLRLHRLRRQPVQLPDRRLQRREGPPEAGRRHDGRGPRRKRASSWSTSSAPKAGHRYTPEAKDEINRRIDSDRRRRPRSGARRGAVHHLDAALQPLVLGQVDGLEQHWEQARVDADLFGDDGDGPRSRTKNVSRLDARRFRPGYCPLRRSSRDASTSTIDGDEIEAPAAALRPLVDGPFPQGRRPVEVGRIGRRRHAAQAARPARADRRRLHGQLPDGPADRHGAQRQGRQVGRPPR